MGRIFILFSFLVLSVRTDNGWRIIGGQVAKPGQFPYYAAMFDSGKHMCGGAIIDENTILTAAHCFKYGDAPQTWEIVVGGPDISIYKRIPQQLKYKIDDIFTHKMYSSKHIGSYDIAIMKTERKIDFSSGELKPIKVASNNDFPKPGTECVAMGYGYTEPHLWENADFLMTTPMTIRPNQYCSKQYRRPVPSDNVCAGGTTYAGVCSGDSGGPLVCYDKNGEATLYGITSYTRTPCGQYNSPGVFTRAGHYENWINFRKNKKPRMSIADLLG